MLVTALIGVTTTFSLEGIIQGSLCLDVKIINELCIPGGLYNDPEGMVCDNDDQLDEAYCSYEIGSNTCAYCASRCARHEISKQCGARGPKRPDTCCAGYVCNDWKKCVFRPYAVRKIKKLVML